jgi:hypothetical protein
MTTAKPTSIYLCYTPARFNEKGCLQVWGGDALSFACGEEEPRSGECFTSGGPARDVNQWCENPLYNKPR